MKHFLTALCLTGGLATALAAQTPQEPGRTPQEPARQSMPATDAKAITVTGCLHEAADQPSLFVLVQSGAESGAASGAAKPAGSHTIYRLSGSGGADMKSSVGAQVQVTGSVTRQAAAPSQKTGKAPASLTASVLRDAAELNVKSFQKIADTCPGSM